MDKPEEPINQNVPPQTPLQPPQPQNLAGQQTAYVGDALQQPDYQPGQQSVEAFAWEAPEYELHHKGAGWIISFIAVTVALLAVAYLTGVVTFMLLVLVLAVAFGVFAFRPPRTLHYALIDSGIEIEGKPYDLAMFRSFGVLHSEHSISIVLTPVKRLGLTVRLRVGTAEADRVIDFLAHSLPLQDMHEDVVDKLFKQLRF